MHSIPVTANVFWRKRLCLHGILLIVLVCSTALAMAARGHSGLQTVSLKVTVNSSEQLDPLAGTVTDISADSLGQYIDGVDGVCATFDTQGDLNVNLSCTGAATPRRFGLNLSNFVAPPTGGNNACTPPTMISPTNPPIAYVNNLLSGQASNVNTAPFQSMLVYDGTPATIYFVQTFINWGLSDSSVTNWRLNYHRPNSVFADATLASYLQVRRVSSTEWVVEPVAPSSLSALGDPPNVAMLVETTSARHASTTTECGFYQVPFSFTLDQK